MESGIKIKCKKRFGQFLITAKPYAIINDVQKELEWDKELFIPLEPNVPYKITIQFRYMGTAAGVASISTEIKLGETQVYEYKTPHVMTSGGSIERKS